MKERAGDQRSSQGLRPKPGNNTPVTMTAPDELAPGTHREIGHLPPARRVNAFAPDVRERSARAGAGMNLQGPGVMRRLVELSVPPPPEGLRLRPTAGKSGSSIETGLTSGSDRAGPCRRFPGRDGR